MTCPPPPPATSTATDIAAKTRRKKKKRQGADGKPPLNIGSLAYPLASLAFSLASTLLTFARGFRRDYGSGCKRVPSIFLFFFLSRFSYNFSEIVSLRRVKVSRRSGVFSAGERDFHDFYLLIDREDPKRRLRSTNLFNLSPLVSLYSRAVSAISCYGIATVKQSPRNMYALFWRKFAKREARRSRDRSPISKSPNVLQKMAKAQDAARHRIKAKIKRYVQLRWRMPFADSVGSCRRCCNKKNKHELIPSFETLKLELNKFTPTSLFLSWKKKKNLHRENYS